ncbi:unnamed protein product [Rotaria sp. Silwood1]|nr:unnamed protein product [Rotaria sp. Silwood1]CAF1334456.1 unnamed protein product [Rotaria sp. Silwood1]CAF1336220.1 unnamed protein product [Rotaria sp. Silwood1]CAF3503891.1 unnamed protein product [Rotaria sp. Silwood1]CAF3560749.1 unnamed protein product [Rotaria sp. Silwood1]
MSNQYPSSTTTSTRSIPSRRKWFIDLQMRKHERLAVAATTTASSDNAVTTTTAAATDTLLLTPVGYSEQRVADIVTHEDNDHLLAKRSWDIALQPIKQLPMNMIFAWMAGNSFSLMSIMIVVMLFMKPIQSIFSLGSAFSSLEHEGLAGNIWFHKIIYFLGNLTHLALALYKCQSMGLLPTYNSDWIAFADQQTQMEMTVGGFSYS